MKLILWTLAALLSHWRHRPGNFLALFVGLAIATALWTGVQALNAQARKSYDRAASVFTGGGAQTLAPASGGAIPQELFVKLRLAGWKVSPVLEATILIRGVPYQLLGVEPLTLPRGVAVGAPAAASGLGAFLTPPGQTLASPEVLRDLGAAEGERIALDNSGKILPPIQANPDAPAGMLTVDIGVAQDLLGRNGQISRLILEKPPGPEAPSLDSLAGAALRLAPPGEEEADLKRLTESFHLNLTAFGLLAFLVGLFIVHAAFGLAFEQRLGMIRTLRAVGVSTRALAAALLGEVVLLALIAGSVGVFGGFRLAAALLPNVAASLDALYGARVAGGLTLDPTWIASGLGIALVGALVAAAGGLTKALRLPVLASAQPFAWRDAQQRFLWRRALLALAAFAAALAAYAWGQNLYSGFAALAGLLLGGALLLPVLLTGALRLGEASAGGPLQNWFWADSRQQLPALSLALTALLLAFATNVGVGGMVEGFRHTFVGWLDGRLAAEVYLEATGTDEAKRIESWLSTRPDVQAVLPGASAMVRLSGWPTGVIGMADHQTYRDRFPMLEQTPDAWDEMKRGNGVLVSEQLARRLNFSLGATLEIPTPRGNWRTKIVGVFPDYGNPKGQLRVDIDALTNHWPDAPRTSFGLRVAPQEAPRVIAALQSQFGAKIARITDQANIRKISTRIFEHTFAVTAALNTLTLVVSAIALLASLTTLGDMRLTQVAPVWASGVSRRHLAQLEFLRILMLTAATAIVALPLGLALAWCLVAVVNVQAFGWRLPYQMFPWQWAEILALALLTAALAALPPLLRFVRTTPAQLARIFANER
ncbi:putative ABC transport system permease protein [Rhodoblastus acidophilus]|uniref:ABC transporter permease n=1 Tax=Rhodoblastus acidophilus TaxID=1074 RepID=UPI00222498DE|nr:ABC transporter permease [Rhodoblastus acidophilus]MCW2284699.1 putative ABC transport system permease protein [Rhodoblastus acidophilus]MCW2333652.1 putative ABC transport system permease protein [Rhodoblastus acidophilus]